MNGPKNNAAVWIKKGQEDLTGIDHLMAGQPVQWSLVCFHAQQAAEKFLKAFLVAHTIEPERTRDLERLLELCAQLDSSLATLREDCSALTDYAVDARYADLLIADEERIARDAVAMADRICTAIRQHLPK